ncbi:hypothetical protein CHELA40_11016 [Chelatococcus asaccharovorans]|nr:hypothetical protein CHELA40_11016 [Chelatococcus asaccharovorans]CAH1685587.1 hypothetical protein CHELA17_64581 [Chelatococcus asaccharovorans]
MTLYLLPLSAIPKSHTNVFTLFSQAIFARPPSRRLVHIACIVTVCCVNDTLDSGKIPYRDPVLKPVLRKQAANIPGLSGPDLHE